MLRLAIIVYALAGCGGGTEIFVGGQAVTAYEVAGWDGHREVSTKETRKRDQRNAEEARRQRRGYRSRSIN